MPKVSVIIPVYNVERYLGECLDSILGQTLKDIEVLCVDDGSTDSSPRILADYAAKDPRVKVLSQPNAGAFRAREKGIAESSGEFIYFMDSDDLLAPEAFAELVELADREGLDQVVFGSTVFCEGDVPADVRRWARGLTRYYTINPECCGRVMSGMQLMNRLIDGDCFHVSPPLRLLRASTVRGRDYPFVEARSRADNYFTVLSLYYASKAMVVASCYYRRRVRNGSITTADGAPARHFRNLLAAICGLYAFTPFTSEFSNPGSALSRFVACLAVALNRWAWKMTDDERERILSETLECASPRCRVLLLQSYQVAVRELKRRPVEEFAVLLRRLYRLCRDWLLRRPHRRTFIH